VRRREEMAQIGCRVQAGDRHGTVNVAPENAYSNYSVGTLREWGAVWVEWDDGTSGYAFINELEQL
jgi:hypothetical protein